MCLMAYVWIDYHLPHLKTPNNEPSYLVLTVPTSGPGRCYSFSSGSIWCSASLFLTMNTLGFNFGCERSMYHVLQDVAVALKTSLLLHFLDTFPLQHLWSLITNLSPYYVQKISVWMSWLLKLKSKMTTAYTRMKRKQRDSVSMTHISSNAAISRHFHCCIDVFYLPSVASRHSADVAGDPLPSRCRGGNKSLWNWWRAGRCGDVKAEGLSSQFEK